MQLVLANLALSDLDSETKKVNASENWIGKHFHLDFYFVSEKWKVSMFFILLLLHLVTSLY